MTEEDQRKVKKALNDPSVELEDVPEKLKITGWWGWPFTVDNEGDPKKFSHTDCNKDYPEKKGFEHAKGKATEHTVEFIKDIWKKLQRLKEKGS